MLLHWFKQIIGRGTRINEDFGKLYFTIMDFKKATELFADKKFDGDPVVIYEPKADEPVVPPDDLGEEDCAEGSDSQEDDYDFEGNGDRTETGDGGATITPPLPGGAKRAKYYVNDVPVKVMSERVQYYGNDGKLITESLKDYTRRAILSKFRSLDVFLQHWTTSEQKQAVLTELEDLGVFFDELAEQVGKDLDPFDLVCHVAFDQPPLTRRERAENVKKRNYFAKYGERARAVLEALLDKYAEEGIGTIETFSVLNVQP